MIVWSVSGAAERFALAAIASRKVMTPIHPRKKNSSRYEVAAETEAFIIILIFQKETNVLWPEKNHEERGCLRPARIGKNN
jgi:hypothetical protein